MPVKIAGRSSEVLADADGRARRNGDDRFRRDVRTRRDDGIRAGCDDELNRAARQGGRELRQPLGPTLRIGVLDREGIALDPSKLAHPSRNPLMPGWGATVSQPIPRARLAGRVRRREDGAGKPRENLPPPHSITSSARARRVGGTLQAEGLAPCCRLMS